MRFLPIHIDVARNTTDDFNPFHDKNRWRNIRDNPFPGPILLGFQLECLLEDQLRRYRQTQDEHRVIEREQLRFSNYDFKFVSAVTCDQDITVSIKPSQLRKGGNTSLGNRVMLYADGRLAMAGFKRETRHPLVAIAPDLESIGPLSGAADRAFLGDSGVFLKRKFMTTSNAKNFLTSALVEQSSYIDEIANIVRFPEIFPCALLSCALLERASQQGHDFELDPMIYQSHSLSIDRAQLHRLRSNDALHLLSALRDPESGKPCYDCFGVVGDSQLLFRARIDLIPLAETLR